MGLTEVFGIIALAGAFGAVGVGWFGSLVLYAAVQYLPTVPPPSAAGQSTFAWSMAASALMAWLLGAVARPQ